MKRLNMPKGYEYLFDGSKLFCDFTDIEKNVYMYFTHKHRRAVKNYGINKIRNNDGCAGS